MTRAKKAQAAKGRSAIRNNVDKIASTTGGNSAMESPIEVDIPVVGRPD